jgi:hypothetical protein
MLLFLSITPDLCIYQPRTKNMIIRRKGKRNKNKGRKPHKAHRGKETKQKTERKLNLSYKEKLNDYVLLK